MPDYSKGKIYAIRAPGTDDVYIGSTTVSLSTRMAQHRCKFNRRETGKYSNTRSSQLLEREGAYIGLIEEYACANKEQLKRREGEVIRATPNTVNKQMPGRTRAEVCAAYNETHKEELIAYRKANKEKKAAYDKLYREKRKVSTKSKECGDGVVATPSDTA